MVQNISWKEARACSPSCKISAEMSWLIVSVGYSAGKKFVELTTLTFSIGLISPQNSMLQKIQNFAGILFFYYFLIQLNYWFLTFPQISFITWTRTYRKILFLFLIYSTNFSQEQFSTIKFLTSGWKWIKRKEMRWCNILWRNHLNNRIVRSSEWKLT